MNGRDTWEALPYADREAIAEHIFEQITASPAASYRKLIYGRLGFEGRSYARLYIAGGMTITNAMHDARKRDDELPFHATDGHFDGGRWWRRLWRSIWGQRARGYRDPALANE